MRPNNFDLARLLLAGIVVFYHCGVLSAHPSLATWTLLDAEGAVEGFFTISGCLIIASWERSASLRDYTVKRARRIFPAYYATTALCLVIATVIFHRRAIAKFLIANVTFMNFLQPGVPGVFTHNPENDAMDGSLWTIRIELMFYCVVPIVVWLARKLGRDRFFIVTALLSIAYRYTMEGELPSAILPHAAWLHARHKSLAVALPGQWSLFAGGALIYYHLAAFRRIGKWLVVPAIALYAIAYWQHIYVLRPLSIPIIVLGFCFLAPEMKGPTRWGDFSYGTYLLHWPIIQTLVALGLFERAPWAAAIGALVLVSAASVLSWYFVEKPWLGRAKTEHAAVAKKVA
jgi:peptidoglycan/LPS O-acetylase OafA/YrhL